MKGELEKVRNQDGTMEKTGIAGTKGQDRRKLSVLNSPSDWKKFDRSQRAKVTIVEQRGQLSSQSIY